VATECKVANSPFVLLPNSLHIMQWRKHIWQTAELRWWAEFS